MIATFCFPCYWKVSIATIPISVQTGACVACFVLYFALGGSLRFRLSLCDVAIGAMPIAEAFSDGWTHKGGVTAIASNSDEVFAGELPESSANAKDAFNGCCFFRFLEWIDECYSLRFASFTSAFSLLITPV
jgi:hypothetical protein